mmetsp:Transcript_44661/g.145112  ORF Transcript_44661/g.145112 Transcript_44661/m.145112 type:complete len:202 (+) Transcript_44661:1494-2099(+)
MLRVSLAALNTSLHPPPTRMQKKTRSVSDTHIPNRAAGHHAPPHAPPPRHESRATGKAENPDESEKRLRCRSTRASFRWRSGSIPPSVQNNLGAPCKPRRRHRRRRRRRRWVGVGRRRRPCCRCRRPRAGSCRLRPTCPLKALACVAAQTGSRRHRRALRRRAGRGGGGRPRRTLPHAGSGGRSSRCRCQSRPGSRRRGRS